MQSTGASAPAEQITGKKRVAALLLAMGKPLADKVLQHFDEIEMREIAETAATLGSVPRTAVDGLVSEVLAAVEQGADIRGSSSDVERLLAGIVTPEKLAVIMSGIRKDNHKPVWARLAEVPEPTVSQHLAKEHPQVAAIVLSRAGSGIAASVLRQIPAGHRTELVRRILAIRPITETALALLEGALQDELLVKVTRENGPPVHSRVADIINKMDRQQMEEVLTDLESKRPKDAKLVKGLLFTFDDIARLSPGDRVKLFDGVPTERTIMALHGASADVREMVLASVSSRSRRMIEQEIATGTAAPNRDVMKARRAIADQALEMAERGVIEIGQQDAPDE